MEFIRIGRISGGHGLEGELKVKVLTDNPELFDILEYLMLAQDGKIVRSYKIEQIREVREMLHIFVEGVETPETANELRGLDVVIPEELLPDTEDGEVYWYRIKGARVEDQTGNLVGALVDYMETGDTEVFRIELDKGGFAMISNNKNHVLKIDGDECLVIVHSDGLVYE